MNKGIYTTIIIVVVVFIVFIMYEIVNWVYMVFEDPFGSTIHWLRIGHDTWDWLAFLVALSSLGVAVSTWISQNKTERNTKQVDDLSQQNILKEFTAHFYRNLIVICALQAKLSGKYHTHYPSEEHLIKMQISMDPTAFRKHADLYDKIYELQLLLNNFNTETEVILMHLKNPSLPDYIKDRDFATLRFKMDSLTKKVTELMEKIWKRDYHKVIAEHLRQTAIIRIGAEGENEEEIDADLRRRIASVRETMDTDQPYIHPLESTFYWELFANQSERDKFYNLLNALIHIEMTANNNQGFPKLLTIPFE